MAGAIDWATLAPAIAAATGVGTIIGSAITIYGGRGRDRREARSRALDCLEQLEMLREGMSDEELLNSEFNEFPEFRQLQVTCMVAGVPRSIVETYGKICNDSCWLNLEHVNEPQIAGLVSAVLLDRAARLVRDALYHPRLARAVSWWRVKRLRSIAWELYGPGPNMVEWTTSLPRLYRRWRQIEGIPRTVQPETASDGTSGL